MIIPRSQSCQCSLIVFSVILLLILDMASASSIRIGEVSLGGEPRSKEVKRDTSSFLRSITSGALTYMTRAASHIWQMLWGLHGRMNPEIDTIKSTTSTNQILPIPPVKGEKIFLDHFAKR